MRRCRVVARHDGYFTILILPLQAFGCVFFRLNAKCDSPGDQARILSISENRATICRIAKGRKTGFVAFGVGEGRVFRIFCHLNAQCDCAALIMILREKRRKWLLYKALRIKAGWGVINFRLRRARVRVSPCVSVYGWKIIIEPSP